MSWNITVNSNDCIWLYIDIPEDINTGCVSAICSHPEHTGRFCNEEICPIKDARCHLYIDCRKSCKELRERNLELKIKK